MSTCILLQFLLDADAASTSKFHPFPEETCLYMSSFDDFVWVSSSMIRPKLVKGLCTDGRPFSLLCKPKDDVRKDQRVQEFFAVVNDCVSRHSRHRPALHTRTFSVIPFGTNNGGLIEWVPDMLTLRSFMDISSDRNDKLPRVTKNSTAEQKMDWYHRHREHNALVMHEQFMRAFSEPSGWLTARQVRCDDDVVRNCRIMPVRAPSWPWSATASAWAIAI